jgi:hypothetical protein
MMTPSLKPRALLAFSTALGLTRLLAGPDTTVATDNSITPPAAPTNIPVSQEFTIEGSYDGGVTTQQGNYRRGQVDSSNGHFNYVVSPQVRDGLLLRFGVDAERNSFGLPSQAPLPTTLQSVNAVIGVDYALNEKILLRLEAHPGIYSDFVSVTSSDIDVPVQFGGTYLYSKDFQIILGGEFDLKSDIPFIIVPAFRWQFADKWVISAIPPRPQLQYELSNALTLYTGAEILDGTYHLNDNFGNNHASVEGPGNANQNGNIVDFTEARVGVGVTWKFTPNLNLDVSGGYVPYRMYDVHPDHIGYDISSTTFHNSIGEGAPYAEVGVRGSF